MNVLEINDTGLLLSNGTQVLAESPGFAALDGKTLQVGAIARARSRLDPRRTFNRYWYQLETMLPAPVAGARSHADLAYAQLQSLRDAAGGLPLMLAVPGSLTREQLSILLGLVDASGLKAEGLVDTAVAAASQVETDATCLHLDVELHRFVLTVIEGGASLSRVRVEEISKPGLTKVWDALSRVAALAFVQQTRFDPLHTAGTEQTMFDALPAWLNLLGGAPSAVLELASGARTHRASVSRDDLVKSLQEPFEDIAAAIDQHGRPRPATLMLSARAAAVPGLVEHIEHVTGIAALRLDALAPARGARAHSVRIAVPGAGLAYVTRLPGIPRGADSAHEAVGPTHVLIGDYAVALPRNDADPALALERLRPGLPGSLRRIEGRLWLDGSQEAGPLLNGKPVRLPVRVGLGDRIDFSGVVLRLIEVMP
ncbi:hypothetical protein DFR24_0935 [Panacagrimonas perspica]|uniref:FHA domain-containing protein n=1 Tax=Panacagrimonas perspica TaxID=381431 RepID=A0A4S3K650_9GAMM|nr:hypothetical protein [Panacagrimonas perspica]TDU31565.1 hypothetical protein DFR24_0935 [Panacagrimonas perspica]THD03204.1 hypothetical protein B1810_11570 [Panacagrimonas perspica]